MLYQSVGRLFWGLVMLGHILKSVRGFTLIESIMTTGLIATGILGMTLVMQNNVTKTVNADHNVKAVNLAQEKIEQILADSSFMGYEYVLSNDAYQNEEIDGGFTRSVSIAEVAEDDLETPENGTGLNKVEVEVAWGEAESQKVKISTIVAEYDTGAE